MAKPFPTIFLEEYLKTTVITTTIPSTSSSPLSSARAIIQAWSDLRDALQHSSLTPHRIQSLKTLINARTSLHVADPQAKLLISLLSSPKISIPPQHYPLFFKLLYIWIRKSFKPNPVLVDSAIEVICNIFSNRNPDPNLGFDRFFFGDGILLLGAFVLSTSASNKNKILGFETLIRVLEENYVLMCEVEGVDIVPDVLAGIGYASASSVDVDLARVLNFLFTVWTKEDGPKGSLSNGLMILHLIEWMISGFVNSRALMKINVLSREVLENWNAKYAPFAVLMASAGGLRALNRIALSNVDVEVLLTLRINVERRVGSIARELVTRMGSFGNDSIDSMDRLALQCLALSLARSGPISPNGILLKCLAFALLSEIFPLRHLYRKVLALSDDGLARVAREVVLGHLGSALFKEGGGITRVFCNQYASADDESRSVVETFIWDFCRDMYMGHRQVALVLRGREDSLLAELERIAESCFLMVVVFALEVTKHKLNLKYSRESQIEASVQILIALSCLEYFRRMRLAEYMDTIRAVVVSVQENESACVSFVESMPSYSNLTRGQDCSLPQELNYHWSLDEVQTARILFYLRVIPTCIERVSNALFRKLVAPTMFLYMGHPNGKVTQASHSLFVAFLSSGNNSFEGERASLKEQIAFYYTQRSLEGFPGVSPFDGMAPGVVALVRHLPAGSPAIFYCINSLVEKTNGLCNEVFSRDTNAWNNLEGEAESCRKLIDLLLRLLLLVDIQVLPELMKHLAQLLAQLPKDAQNTILDDLYTQVAESDDVTRKPALVSWLQSLDYVCSQAALSEKEKMEASSTRKDWLSWATMYARL